MSRSFKKNPFQAVCCYISNKKDKTIANRLFRRKSKRNLKVGKELPYSIREVSDTYNFSSDGLPTYVGKHDYDFLTKLGYSLEYIEELYKKIFRK